MAHRLTAKKIDLLQAHSLSSSFNSPVTFVDQKDNVGYQIDITTSDSTGTFAVQVSNDYSEDSAGTVKNAGTWTSLVMSGVPSVSAANDTIIISLNQLPFAAVRLAYTPTVAGTGTCNASIIAKQLGG